MRDPLIRFTILLTSLVSCNEQRREAQTELIVNDTVAVSAKLPSVQVTNESVVYDTLVFPGEIRNAHHVLTVGAFHSDEVESNAAQLEWLGIFVRGQRASLEKTNVRLEKVYDTVLDEEGEKTGWGVSTPERDSCVMLIASMPNLEERSIERLSLRKYVYPGDTVEFQYLGIDYKLLATGEKRKVQDNPEYYEVWNYKLYLTAKINGVQKNSLLVALPNFDDNMITMIFAGDIDGDRVLDLIIDTSRHYNATSPTLYLSRPAEDGEILRPIGQHTSVGC